MQRLKAAFSIALLAVVLCAAALVPMWASAIQTVGSGGPSVAGWTGTAYQSAETDNGDSGTADTIDWTAGNNQLSTLTGNVTYTFTPPGGPAHLTLRMVQDATGSRTVSWPTEVSWDSDTEPTWDTTASVVNIAVFYYDGSGYYGSGMVGMPVAQPILAFQPDSGQAGTAADGAVGVSTASATLSALIATTPNLVGDQMGALGGPLNTLQSGLQASTTTDEFAAVFNGVICFDTSSGISGTPTGATLTIHNVDNSPGDNPSDGLAMTPTFHVVAITPSNPGTLAAADFATIGSTSLGSVAFAAIDQTQPTLITIDPTAINTSGVTCFAIVTDDQITETFTGTWSSGAITSWTWESAENTNPPTLEVSW